MIKKEKETKLPIKSPIQTLAARPQLGREVYFVTFAQLMNKFLGSDSYSFLKEVKIKLPSTTKKNAII